MFKLGNKMKLTYLKLDTVNLSEESFQKLVLLENNANVNPYSAEQLKEIITQRSNSTFVCFYGDKIVGMLTINDNSKKFGGSIYVVNLSVDKDYQRKGIATQLFIEASKYYENININRIMSLEVDKTNNKAIGLYKKLGFNFVEDYNDEEQYGMTMSLEELNKLLKNATKIN